MARVNCDPSILQRDTMPGYKPKETTPVNVSPSDKADGRTSYVVMSTAALVVAVSVAVVSVVRKICRRRSNNIRVQGDHDLSPRRVHTSSVTYETLHRYWEISDADVGASAAAVMTAKDTGDETSGAMAALADVFCPNVDEQTSHNETPEDLVWNYCSYSHLGTDRVSETKTRNRKTRTLVRYLTPSNKICQFKKTTSLDHWPMQPSSGTKDTTVNTI
ncbi:uncharacterized protein LOC124252906 [Haliotis rubra]|uniref:uncharacterized protein LOC124252906 n=1 Tax=Haliotis rubra TaxID=36100 RepID=UPI001EE5B47F|nr:uncharacterized protein LOC124252906 [Haliotis rubra]